MDVRSNTPCFNNAAVCVAGCTKDGLVYAAAIDPIIYDMNLWVHSGVQEKWHLLATSKLASVPELGYRNCLMSAALTHDHSCVDVFLEAAESSDYLFRFFISDPKENCIYKCVDAKKIQFDGLLAPFMHWLGDDCLLVAGWSRHENGFHIWRIDVDKESMAFHLTDLLAYDLGKLQQAVIVCADQDFLYVFGVPPGQIKLHTKSHDGNVKFCHEIVFPISRDKHELGYICAYPSTGGQRLLLPHNGYCYVVDCQLQSAQQMFKFDDDDYYAYNFGEKLCTASSAQFFCLKANGRIGQKCIGMPSLQYMCLRKLCRTWPTLKMCTDEKGAKNLGIPPTIWNRFFKPLMKVEQL